MYKIVVLASGNGSNFEEIVKQTRRRYNDIHVALLISDKKNAYVLTRAKELDVPYVILPSKNRFEYLKEIIDEQRPDLVVLAGFMRIIPKWFVDMLFGKIVNIHPSLLPSFKGKDAIKQAWEYGVKVTGVTIHFVDSGVDTGPIIFQVPVTIEPHMNLELLEKKIHSVEHKIYTPVINMLLKCDWIIDGRTVKFLDTRGDACEIFRTVARGVSSEIWGESS